MNYHDSLLVYSYLEMISFAIINFEYCFCRLDIIAIGNQSIMSVYCMHLDWFDCFHRSCNNVQHCRVCETTALLSSLQQDTSVGLPLLFVCIRDCTTILYSRSYYFTHNNDITSTHSSDTTTYSTLMSQEQQQTEYIIPRSSIDALFLG